MSPRRNRPSRSGSSRRDGGGDRRWDPEALRRGVDTVETWGGERWRVRQIPGSAAVKTYRCPGCDHEIPPGVPHLVVWSLERLLGYGGEEDRRHWHTGCWRARPQRFPGR